MAKKVKEINKILNLTNQQSRQILQILEDLRSINSQTDEKCPIDYDEHYETSDDNITTINFHYKNIFNRNEEIED